MENDNRRIETFEHFDNIKQGYKELTSNNNKNKEEIIMNLVDKKTNPEASQVLLSSGNGVTNTNSPKMGSRRIFTPQFKLQVLESYRNDHDCKGNQRATARKYNIHRRQIQKWLQCEPSLRSSVANINQNSVKHQFHNVSMQQQQTKNVVIATQPSVNNLSYTTTSQLHSAHLCLDSTKRSTSHKAINVPLLSSCVRTSSAQETQDILDSNLVAVCAAAGTIARTNTSSTSSVTPAVVSPLRPSAIIGANITTSSSMSPLLHHHHHHHYGIPSYSTMSSTANVPILVHHLTNSQQASYQYHNMPYSHATLSHQQPEKQNSTSYFTPISPPTVNVLPATASASNSYTGGDTEHIEKLNLFPIAAKKYPKISSDKNFLYSDNQFHATYECLDGPRVVNSSNTLESLTLNHFNGELPYSTMYPFAPMDLSLRHGRETKPEIVPNIKTNFQMSEIHTKKKHSDNALDVVDLTYRKRKVFSNSHSSNDYKNEFPEKQQKLWNPDPVQNALDSNNTSEICHNHMTTNPTNSVEDDDIEIEVGIEEKFPPASKPVKLFKPYLLDECENNKDNYISCNTIKLSKNEKSEEKEQNAKKDDATISKNNFQDLVKENIHICVDSSNFLLESRSESPRSACSTATSPTNFQYPKGSPASSGYESSTSSYSDTSSSSRNDTYTYGKTYSVNLQMQTIYQENIHVIHPSKHVQRWLEKEDSNSIETNSTIALLV